jgi:hypothetical protein
MGQNQSGGAGPNHICPGRNRISVNGEGSLDVFVAALVLDSGELTHLRMSPLVAWEVSDAVHDVGTAEAGGKIWEISFQGLSLRK